MSWSTRSAISTAAFSVKVRASTSSGRARLDEMRCAMRRVRTVVLPVPAPAMISRGPSPWSTASRWRPERPSRTRSSEARTAVSMAPVWHAGVRGEDRSFVRPRPAGNRRCATLVPGPFRRRSMLSSDTSHAKARVPVIAIACGVSVQDAYLEWKASDAFALDAGLIFIPLCRNCIQSAAALLPLDYGAYSFLHGGPTRSVVGRDTGFMAKGYLAKSRLEYRVGAFQGVRDALSRNSFRSSGHLQYSFLDTETTYFTTGTYLGKKKVFTVGGGYDVQADYKAFAGDAYFDRPLGPAGALTLQGDLIYYDGGRTFADLPRQNDYLVEGGYFFTKAKVMPWLKVEGQKFASPNSGRSQDRFQGGLSYFHQGHNVNIKAGYGRINPKTGRSTNLFTIQLQVFYF